MTTNKVIRRAGPRLPRRRLTQRGPPPDRPRGRSPRRTDARQAAGDLPVAKPERSGWCGAVQELPIGRACPPSTSTQARSQSVGHLHREAKASPPIIDRQPSTQLVALQVDTLATFTIDDHGKGWNAIVRDNEVIRVAGQDQPTQIRRSNTRADSSRTTNHQGRLALREVNALNPRHLESRKPEGITLQLGDQ